MDDRDINPRMHNKMLKEYSKRNNIMCTWGRMWNKENSRFYRKQERRKIRIIAKAG